MDSIDTDIFEIFPWHHNFDTGIAVIDEQHKKLVHILNKLAAHLANRSNSVVLNTIFDELANYADYHFKTEENIWSRFLKEDAWFKTHEKTHASFASKVLLLKQEENTKPLDDVIFDIVSFLTQWLAYHILDSDKRMAKVVLGIESGKTIEQAKVSSNEEMSGSMEVLINTVLTMYDNLSNRTMALMRERALRIQAEEALTLSEERWKFILDGVNESVWDWDIEKNEASYSEKNEPLIDNICEKFLKMEYGSHIHPDDIKQVKADFQAHLEGKTEFYINKHRVMRENNSYFWVVSRGKVISRDAQGKATRMVGTHTDITERELAALLYRQSGQGMFITDVNNSIISINPAFTTITGYEKDEILGENPSYLASGRHGKKFFNQLWDSITATGGWHGEIWNKRKNGEIFPQILTINSVKDDHGFSNHHVALFTDITEKKKADETIKKQANYDPLTKLANRYLFQQNLQHEIDKSKRTKLSLALLFIDLDHFKDVNDTNGHDVGDNLLIEVAERIKSKVRTTDAVARLGGDEYTVILPEIKDTATIEKISQKIIDELRKPFLINNHHQIFISASIGITLYPDDGLEINAMQKHADQAMYKAKAKGRNCYSFFTQSMEDEAIKNQKLANALRCALKEGQFEVYYQPIADIESGEILKAEALLRWNHPTQGMVSPAEFIPLAEETGFIVEIGDWVFQQVAHQLKNWISKYHVDDFKVSINKSPIQFLSKQNHRYWLDYLFKESLKN